MTAYPQTQQRALGKEQDPKVGNQPEEVSRPGRRERPYLGHNGRWAGWPYQSAMNRKAALRRRTMWNGSFQL
jgi:hypothetical protein